MPPNPCDDPPGRFQVPPTAEGGALRSQDIRTSSDPTGLSGTILRLDPDTGAAMADNPNAGSPDPNARRIVAYGLRNPFRITVRPGTNEIWAGDVGWREWEEINRLETPTGTVRNFGWPCYEGAGRQSAYDDTGLNVCESLYNAGAAAHAQPHFTYAHHRPITAGETCSLTRRRRSPAWPSHPGQQLPAQVRRRPVLRRLQPQVHLGDAGRRRRRAEPGAGRDLRRRSREPGRAPVRPERRPLLRRPRWRHHPPRPLAHREPRSGRAGDGDAVERPGAADRGLRRACFERPGRRRPGLLLGSRRRRRLRRLDRGSDELHLPRGGQLHGAPACARRQRPDRHAEPPGHRGHAADGRHRLSRRGDDLDGRRHDRRQRLRQELAR